jgi:hypothetical protein
MRRLNPQNAFWAMLAGILLITGSCQKDDDLVEPMPEYRVKIVDALSGTAISGVAIEQYHCVRSNGEFMGCGEWRYESMGVSDANGFAHIKDPRSNYLRMNHDAYFSYDALNLLQENYCWEPSEVFSGGVLTLTVGLYPRIAVRFELNGNKQLGTDAYFLLDAYSSIPEKGSNQTPCHLTTLDFRATNFRFPANRDTMFYSYAVPGKELTVRCRRFINYEERLSEFKFPIPAHGEASIKFTVP